MGFLKPIVTDVSQVIGSLGISFRSLVNDTGVCDVLEVHRLREGSATVNAGGGAILNFLDGFVHLLPQFKPLIDAVNSGITGLGRSFDALGDSSQGRQDVQGFLAWLKVNGPAVGHLLQAMGGAVVTLMKGFALNGAGEEIKLLTGFFNRIQRLPKGWIGPVSDLAGTLLIISKFGFGRKIISVAVNWVGQGAAALLKWLSRGTLDLAGKFEGRGMQRAANTMLDASVAMQRAADTMAGASTEGAAGGAAGSAAKGGLAATAGSIARLLAIPVIVAAAARLATTFLPDPTKQQTTDYKNRVPGWLQAIANIPFAGKAATVFARAPSLSPLWHDIAGGDTVTRGKNSERLDHQSGAVPMAWSKAYEAFQRDFAGKITHWFTVSLPDVFTKTIPHWFDNAYQSFFRDVVNPISHAVDNVTHVFTKTIPHWFDSAAAAFSSDVVAPVRRFITGTVPGFFTRTVPHWWDSAAKFFSSDVVAPVRGFVTNAIPGFFTRTIPHWFDSARSAFSTDVVSPVRNFITGTIPGFFTRTIPHWFDSAGHAFSSKVVSPITNFFKRLPSVIEGAFRSGINWIIGKINGLVGAIPGAPRSTLSRAAACCPGTRPAGTACPRCCPPARASSSPRRSAGSAARRRSTRSTTPTPATGEPASPAEGSRSRAAGSSPTSRGWAAMSCGA